MIILLVILIYVNYAEASSCSEKFEQYFKPICEGIQIDYTHICKFSNGQCIFKPYNCDLYEGKEESICNAIKLSNIYKKCTIINKCSEVNKKCSDYDKQIPCESLYAGTNSRCILKNGECQTHYNNCESFTSNVDEIKCKRNIPSNNSQKCIWENNKCKEVKKVCEDYSENCGIQTISDINKICIYSSSLQCREQYKTCELYEENALNKNQAECESIKIYLDRKGFDDFHFCTFSGGKCLTRDKKCSDLKYSCSNLTPKDNNKYVFI